MLMLRNASALVSEQWVSASQVQVSIFLPHYADDVLCKFLMELLSTSDLIFTQGAKLLKSYLQPECISTLNIYSNSFMKSRRKKHPKAIDNNKEMHCASFYWWFSYWVWVTNYGSSWRRGRHQAPGESWRWRARIGNIMAAVFMSDSKWIIVQGWRNGNIINI